MKKCNKCLEIKSKSDFFARNKAKNYISPYCKKCFMEINNKYKKANPEKIKQIKKRESSKNKEGYRNRNLMLTYGITLSDYNNMLIKQNNECAICRTTKGTRKNGRLDVDHCHKTGKVRALLCGHCNVLLSRAKDNIEILKKAIEYLKEHNEKDK